jgi:soluble lytic murein transglycosylase-like protein
MRLKIGKTGGVAIAVAIAATGSAQAQTQTAPASEIILPPEQTSVRSAGSMRIFQMIEHGIRQQPDAEPPLGPANSEHGGVFPPFRQEPNVRGGPSGFRRASYLPHIYAAELRYALPRGLLDALVWTESRYNPSAVSKAGAAGLGQLMPGTARDLGVANRFDPLANIDGAARYLRQMLDKFGVVHLALAAYNAGPGAVERGQGIPRNGETPAYVSNVLRYWQLVTENR